MARFGQDDQTYTSVMTDLTDERRLHTTWKGFQAAFGNMANGSETFYINDRTALKIEIIRSGEPIAALIPRGTIQATLVGQKIYQGEKSTIFDRTFPLSHEEDKITADETFDRVPGELNVVQEGGGWTRQQRMTYHASRKHEEHIRKIMRLHEYLAAQSILTGKMPAILGTSDPDQIYDFRRNPDNTFQPLDQWNDDDTKILPTFDVGCDLVIRNGLGVPKMAVMGEDAWPVYLGSDEVRAYHDNKGYELARMSDRETFPAMFDRYTGQGGFEPRGTLITPKGRKLYLFSYEGFYQDLNGDQQLFMPKDQLVILDPMIIANRYFGPGQKLWNTRLDAMWMEDIFGFGPMGLPMPENMPNSDIIDPRMFHFYAYEQDKEFVTLVTQSAPVFATNQTDAVAVATDLINYSP